MSPPSTSIIIILIILASCRLCPQFNSGIGNSSSNSECQLVHSSLSTQNSVILPLLEFQNLMIFTKLRHLCFFASSVCFGGSSKETVLTLHQRMHGDAISIPMSICYKDPVLTLLEGCRLVIFLFFRFHKIFFLERLYIVLFFCRIFLRWLFRVQDKASNPSLTKPMEPSFM